MQVPMEVLLHHPMFLILPIFLSFFVIMKPILASTDPLSYALLSLKSELVDNSNSLQDWLLPFRFQPSSQICACSWTGVKCTQNSSQIITLDLSNKKLGGSLSGFKHFNLFLDLVDLNLSHNSFSSQLPAGVFNLRGLKTLDISRNNFSGHFPSGVSNLQNLVVLDAFSNSFSGFLPADVSKIESLKILNFAGSYFSGPIPSDYGLFQAVEFIHLAGNFLSGELPSELGQLKTLSHLEIGYNSYEGEIPWQFGNMSELQYLDIADANISGPIPKELSNLTKLESLFLFRNLLIGKIPVEFGLILTLRSLDLSDNLISGPIPDSFSELKNLMLLSLMYNDLSGLLPQGISKLPFLDTLLIWNNYLTGSLPEGLGRFSKLKHLDVSTNYFVGIIPPDICSGGELEKLILFSNNFTGGLFPSLSNCSSLVRLRIEDNSFSGGISLKFGNLPYISYVDLSRNRFVGGVSSDIDRAFELEYFNVSYNTELGGVLPVKLWSLPNLRNLSMASCGVSAKLPPFEDCKSISVIELRGNNLSGPIPESVLGCKHLLIMDLANNSLSGPIPWNSAFEEAMDKSAFFGNPNLCGGPLRPCRRENGISSGYELGSRGTRKLVWVLVLCAVVVLFIVAAVFGIVYFKRGSKGHWKMVAFNGLPQFTAKDVLRSFALPGSIGKVVLPTGIAVSAKKMEWESKEMKGVLLRNLTRIGNVRHGNLTRLLGVCYNNNFAYLLYDYLPNGNLGEEMGPKMDWDSKCKLLVKVARALCFLHHGCYPAIPHGNLKSSNVLFDENMEPHLAEYGLSSITESQQLPGKIINKMGGSIRDEVCTDVYDFGELLLEVVTNGRIVNASEITQKEDNLIRDVARENGSSDQEGVKLVIEVALLCTGSRPSDRPSMQDVLKLLSGLNSMTNGTGHNSLN